MHDFKMALQPEIAQRVSEKLDQLLLVFAEGSAYKIKYGYPGRDGHPKFYLQLDALCSSKHSLLPDISLNDDGLCRMCAAGVTAFRVVGGKLQNTLTNVANALG